MLVSVIHGEKKSEPTGMNGWYPGEVRYRAPGLSTIHGPGGPWAPKTLTLRVLGAPGASGALEPREAQTMNCNFAGAKKAFTLIGGY